MAIRELKQTHYLDVADANIRHDTRDHRQDMTHYHVPLMRLHQAALHGWGIAVGLEVTQTGPAELTIAEGLAIDAQGRMLPLAAAGHAPGQPGKAFVHTTSPDSLVDVPVVVPMGEIDDGTYYVTMELAVTPGPEGPVEGRFLANEGRVVSTPLVQLHPMASFTPDGQAIILATATLAEGAVTQLHGADRQLAHLAAGAVVIRRSAELGADETGPAVGETVGGRLAPLATGGVQVTVPQAGDQVAVHQEGERNFGELTVRADHVRVLDGTGRDVMHAEANTATLRLGTQGRAGMLVVQDANGGEALRIDADHEILFPEHGQIRAFDDTHKLVFDRPQNRLELHEQGDIRLLTGAPTPTERVRILATGAVGIGTQTPTQALEVAGTIKATAFQGDGSALTAVRDHTKVSKTGDTMTGPLAIRGAGTSLNITSNARVGGNLTVGDRLGIGTGNPAFQLSLGRSLGRTKLALYETGASNSYGLGVTAGTFRLHLNGNRARFAFFDSDEEDAKEIVTISGNGDLTVTGTARKPGGGSWSNISDLRLKKNIQHLTGALDALLRLRGVRFEWIEPEKQGNLTGLQIGLVAQEVEAIFPEWVNTTPDGYKELSIRGFEALTVEALRELQADHEAWQDQYQALEARIKAMERQVLAQHSTNVRHGSGEA